ncbi:MAG: hypothetical protein KF693_14715 [Nitrospira sp.]|nr:hypothetical protein [Nitrospira sp.]
MLLGEEDFVEKLTGYVKRYEKMAEIHRSQRYLSRPKLTRLFDERLTKAKQDTAIIPRAIAAGTAREVADLLRLHYAIGQPNRKQAVIQEARPDPYVFVHGVQEIGGEGLIAGVDLAGIAAHLSDSVGRGRETPRELMAVVLRIQVQRFHERSGRPSKLLMLPNASDQHLRRNGRNLLPCGRCIGWFGDTT